jgi:hypothetical protein
MTVCCSDTDIYVPQFSVCTRKRINPELRRGYPPGTAVQAYVTGYMSKYVSMLDLKHFIHLWALQTHYSWAILHPGYVQISILKFTSPLIALRVFLKDYKKIGARGSVVVEALCYKPEGLGFDTRSDEFLNLLNLSGRTRAWGLLSL